MPVTECRGMHRALGKASHWTAETEQPRISREKNLLMLYFVFASTKATKFINYRKRMNPVSGDCAARGRERKETQQRDEHQPAANADAWVPSAVTQLSSPCSDVTAVTADSPCQVCSSWLINLGWCEECGTRIRDKFLDFRAAPPSPGCQGSGNPGPQGSAAGTKSCRNRLTGLPGHL